jgi:hypothetical protein
VAQTDAANICSPEEIASAAEASVYYGVAGLADVIRRLPNAANDDAAELDIDEAYDRVVPTTTPWSARYGGSMSNRPATLSRSRKSRERSLVVHGA